MTTFRKIMQPYRIIEHTADIGLALFGKTLQELFVHAGTGLFDLITDLAQAKKRCRSSQSAVERLELEAPGADELLMKWLKELLFIFSTKGIIVTDFEFEMLSEKQLKAKCQGVKFEPSRDVQKYEIKAVTYHQYELKKEKNIWQARVIFDI